MAQISLKINHHPYLKASFIVEQAFFYCPALPQITTFDLGMEHQQYTKQQLALRNGQDKPQIWVAFKGFIYDVSESRLWRNGKHYEHWAGQDLTDELSDAPHTETVFEKFVIVGVLK